MQERKPIKFFSTKQVFNVPIFFGGGKCPKGMHHVFEDLGDGSYKTILGDKIYFMKANEKINIDGYKITIDGTEATDEDPRILKILDANGNDIKPKNSMEFKK